MNFYDLPFSSPPTRATRIDEDHHAFSIDSCWKRNERQSYRKPAQPWPKPSQPQENTRAIAQLEQCAQIRLPWYLDDQSRVCCALPCASSPCPFHSACGRIINDRIPLCEDTHTSHYCSQCYESMHHATQCRYVLMPCPVPDRATQLQEGLAVRSFHFPV